LALSATLAACGGSSKAATATPTTTTAPGQASFAQYNQCLTSHGVPAGSTGLFGRGRPDATGTRPTIPSQYQAAFQACASLRPRGGLGGGNFNSPQFAAYRNCLQLHGVTTPTTTPGQPPSTGNGSGLRNSPAFQAAQKACASLAPARPGSTSTTLPPAS
jgi:hypothetical protein